MNCRQQIEHSNKSEMNAQQKQELFNKLAEMLVNGEITREEAVRRFEAGEEEESEDFDWECEYCNKGGFEDQEGAVVKSAFENGCWSEIVGWCNESHHKKWLKRQEKRGSPIPEHFK